MAVDRSGDEIGPASGLFFRANARVYLVTNWHVASGYNPETNMSLSSNGREPWSLKIAGRVSSDGVLSTPIDFVVPARDAQTGAPCWLEHPTFGRRVDLAAFDLSALQPAQFHCANDDIIPGEHIFGPGDGVFILGYPRGISGGRYLPIWKSGAVASEPEQPLDGLPRFLVDATTTEGMSGSPVIIKSEIYKVPAPHRTDGQHECSVGKTIQKLVGVYSGRISKLTTALQNDPAAAQLGFVWPAHLISEIVHG